MKPKAVKAVEAALDKIDWRAYHDRVSTAIRESYRCRCKDCLRLPKQSGFLLAILLLCGCAHSKPVVLFRGESQITREPRHTLGSGHAHASDGFEWQQGHRSREGYTNVSVPVWGELQRKSELWQRLTEPLPELPPLPPK